MALHLVCVFRHCLGASARLQVPKLDLCIAGAGRKSAAVRVHCHTEDPGLVPCMQNSSRASATVTGTASWGRAMKRASRAPDCQPDCQQQLAAGWNSIHIRPHLRRPLSRSHSRRRTSAHAYHRTLSAPSSSLRLARELLASKDTHSDHAMSRPKSRNTAQCEADDSRTPQGRPKPMQHHAPAHLA